MVLYFIGFELLNSNTGYPSYKRGQIYIFFKGYCAFHTEIVYLHKNFLWSPEVITCLTGLSSPGPQVYVRRDHRERSYELGLPQREIEAPAVSGDCSDGLQGSHCKEENVLFQNVVKLSQLSVSLPYCCLWCSCLSKEIKLYDKEVITQSPIFVIKLQIIVEFSI